jgi:hypothetical protein
MVILNIGRDELLRLYIIWKKAKLSLESVYREKMMNQFP